MGIDMDQADRPVGTQRLQDRICDRVIAAHRQRDHASGSDLPVEGLDILVAGFQAEAAAEADIPDICGFAASQRGHFRACS